MTLLEQYPSAQLIDMLNDPHPLVRQAIGGLLESKDLKRISDNRYLVITQGFAASFELTRLIANRPDAKLYTVVACYQALTKLKLQWCNSEVTEELSENLIHETAQLCLQQTLLNLSVYGTYAYNVDRVLPAFFKLPLVSEDATREERIQQMHLALQTENLSFRYHPQMRNDAARIEAKQFKDYWSLAVALEGLLRAQNIEYTDPLCQLDASMEDWLSIWSEHIPKHHVIVVVDEFTAEVLTAKYFFIVSPMTASELRLLFGKYGASGRVNVWNHGASF